MQRFTWMLTFGLVTAAAATASQAAIVASEDFDYTAGQAIQGKTGGSGWGGAWGGPVVYGAANATVASGSLSYPGLPAPAPGSNSYQAVSTTGGSYTTQARAIPTPINDGVLWFSVLLHASAGSGFVDMDLTEAVSGGTDRISVVAAVGANFAVGIDGQSGDQSTPVTFNLNTTYLLVMRATMRASGADTVDVWVNPTSTADAVQASSTHELGTLARVVLESGNVMTVQYDQLRVGTSFDDVAPFVVTAPAPAAMPGGLVLGMLMVGARRRR